MSDPSAWIARARQDIRSARRLLGDPPEIEDAAFHLHQAVEKAGKAVLADAGIRFPRGGSAGHDLVRLSELMPVDGELHDAAVELSRLTPWATAFRYPADDPLTAEPLPSRDEIERWLVKAEWFVDAAARATASRPSEP